MIGFDLDLFSVLIWLGKKTKKLKIKKTTPKKFRPKSDVLKSNIKDDYALACCFKTF